MAKVLKGCNCCLSSKRKVRLMNAGARVAWCYQCKAKTVWSDLTPDEAAAHEAKKADTEALFERLFKEIDNG